MGSSFPLTFIFFRGVGIPPTSSSMNDIERLAWKLANQTGTSFSLWFSECRGSKAPARALSNSASERSSYLFHSVPSFSQRFQLSEPQNFSIVQQLYISCKACIRIHLAGSLKGHWTGHWTLGVSPLPWPAPSPRCTASPAATPRPSCRGRWQQRQHSRRRSKGRRWRRRRRSMASMRSRQGGRWKTAGNFRGLSRSLGIKKGSCQEFKV